METGLVQTADEEEDELAGSEGAEEEPKQQPSTRLDAQASSIASTGPRPYSTRRPPAPRPLPATPQRALPAAPKALPYSTRRPPAPRTLPPPPPPLASRNDVQASAIVSSPLLAQGSAPQAAPAPQAPKNKYTDEQLKSAKEHGWVEGEDDLDTVMRFILPKDQGGVGQAMITLKEGKANFTGAMGLMDSKGKNPEFAHIPPQELYALFLYTTNAAYPMNAIKRGLLNSHGWQAMFGVYLKAAERGLRKLQEGAPNLQTPKGLEDENYKGYAQALKVKPGFFDRSKAKKAKAAAAEHRAKLEPHLLDKTKDPSARLDVQTLYRSMRYGGLDFTNYKTGGTLTDPGFVSTSIEKGSYGADYPVHWTIQNQKNARSLVGISQVANEKEMLMPPGQAFRIVRIERVHKDGPREVVHDVLKQFPNGKHTEADFRWEVTVDHVGDAPKALDHEDSESDSES